MNYILILNNQIVLILKLLKMIFVDLDNGRVKQLIQLVNNNLFGQIFISDTDYDRTHKIIQEIDSTHKIFKL